MQKIERKKDKHLSAKVILLSVLFFAALSALAVVFLNHTGPKEEPASAPRSEADLTIYKKDLSLLTSVTLYRKGEEQLTLNYQDGTFSLDGRADFPLRSTSVEYLAETAAGLTADEIILEKAESEALSAPAFGLSPAERSARFRYSDGEEIILSIGALMPIENPRYYAAVSGKDMLFSVTQDIRDSISLTVESLHPVERPQVNHELLDRITISGDASFDAVRTPEGWQMQKPFSYPLSDSAMETLLERLDNLRFATWIDDAGTLNLADYGLSPAVRTMTLTFAETVVTAPDETGQEVSFRLPENEMSFSLGDARNETSFYMLYNDQVYSATYLTFSFLKNFSWDRYLLLNPLSWGANNLSAVSWTREDQSAEYRIRYTEKVLPNNELETDKYGNILYEMFVTRDGAPVDTERFSAWYQSLGQIQGTQRCEAQTFSEDTPVLLSVTVVNEAGTASRTVTICEYSAVQDILFVDGVSLFLIDRSWRDSLTALP